MKVVVSGHTFVQRENWARWERFAELYPDSHVTLLVPSTWREDRYGVDRVFVVHPYEKGNFCVLPVDQIEVFGRKFHRSFGLKLKRLQPDIYFITEERYGWWPYQELLYRRIFCRDAVSVGFTTTNIDYKLAKLRHRIKESMYFREMDAIVAANRDAYRILREHGYAKPMLVQQENGADERVWCPGRDEELRKRLRLGDFTIGYVGTLREEKGVLDLVEAVLGLESDDWTLVFIGDGPERERILSVLKAGKRLENARVLGYMERKEIPRYIRELDVLILPSRTTPKWKEQFGLVLAEAMLSRVAVIGSSSGAIPEVIGNAGLIFEEGNVRQLSEYLNLLMNNKKMREELAEKGYRRALARYSATAMSRQIHDFFNQLLKRKGRYANSRNHHAH
ncbi:MAG: glycosyltransferase family 4 protein [Candidatus Methanomethylicaceae archaeon]